MSLPSEQHEKKPHQRPPLTPEEEERRKKRAERFQHKRKPRQRPPLTPEQEERRKKTAEGLREFGKEFGAAVFGAAEAALTAPKGQEGEAAAMSALHSVEEDVQAALSRPTSAPNAPADVSATPASPVSATAPDTSSTTDAQAAPESPAMKAAASATAMKATTPESPAMPAAADAPDAANRPSATPDDSAEDLAASSHTLVAGMSRRHTRRWQKHVHPPTSERRRG